MSLEGWYPEELDPPKLEREGIRLGVPLGWEGRIRRQEEDVPGGRTYNVLHASTVPLSGQRADYGGGVVERLGSNDVFVSLIEFGPNEASSALYADVDRIPRLQLSDFHRNQLQRRLKGQAGVQRFFTINGRPFCLYVVLGSIANSRNLVGQVNELLSELEIEAL